MNTDHDIQVQEPPRAPVNKIIPFSNVDGPGNRTAIFLQECNFDCKYCHNPETRKLCINCGFCVSKCPTQALSLKTLENGKKKVSFHPDLCAECDTCIKVCPNDASPRIRYLTPEETFLEIKKQMPYIRGITVSGGECTLYPAYLKELFKLCQNAGLTTFIDSNGTYPFASNSDLLAVTDGVMLDIKAFSEEDHIRVTGCENSMVLQNALHLAKEKKLFEVRTVIVPDLFDTKETITETGKLLASYLPIRYKIIAFRPMGVRKQYTQFSSPSDSYLQELSDLLHELGWNDVVII